jgi:hypothetical protein
LFKTGLAASARRADYALVNGPTKGGFSAVRFQSLAEDDAGLRDTRFITRYGRCMTTTEMIVELQWDIP